jgi:phosphatidylserine/phosphatidylglycerophosphate/cardiolipin synthase-like enzyme
MNDDSFFIENKCRTFFSLVILVIHEFKGYYTIDNSHQIFNSIINEGLLQAKKTVWLVSAKTTDFIIKNPRSKEALNFSQKLVQMRNWGVTIRLLLSPKERKRSLYQKLKTEPNISFKFCYNIHMKAIIIDERWMYFGSANLTGAGLGSRTREGRNNFETKVVTLDQNVIQSTVKLLESIWDGKECTNCYQKKKGYCKGII